MEEQDKKEIVVEKPVQRTPVLAGGKIAPIVPRDIDEAWRLSTCFVRAGMVPNSLSGKTDEETTAKVMGVIMKGMEVGFGPAMSIQTIMIINNKPSIYGDGIAFLLQRSGFIEYIKTDRTGNWDKKDYLVTITLKRKDQIEPYVRSFGYQDAVRAKLSSKPGPWTQYPERQCYWRALSWVARDGAADALGGLQIAEEVFDYTSTTEHVEREEAQKQLDVGMDVAPVTGDDLVKA